MADRTLAGMPRQRNIAQRLASAPATPASAASLEYWQRHVSVPSLASPFLVFAQCLAYAAPIAMRLRRRPVGWCFHGPKDSGRTGLPELALSLYGNDRGLHTWQQLGAGLSDATAAQDDGLLAIMASEPATDDVLDRLTTAARLWLDGVDEAELPHRRDVIGIFDSDTRVHAHMLRGRFGLGKLWVMNIAADAGAGHGIYATAPEEGYAAGAAAMLLNRARKTSPQVGVSWLRFVNWWPHERLAIMFKDEHGSASDEEPLDSGTGLSVADVSRCLTFVSRAGEWATEQGFTGWPLGAAYDASIAMLRAWDASIAAKYPTLSR